MRAPRGLGSVLLLLVLAACGRAPDKQSPAAAAVPADTTGASAAPKRVILFLGTSLTAGYGLDADQAFPAVVARRLDSLHLNYEVVNAGVSGETSADARNRVATSVHG